MFPDRLRDGCGLKISAGCWLGEKTAVKNPGMSFEVTVTWDAKVIITLIVTLGAEVAITSGTQSDNYFGSTKVALLRRQGGSLRSLLGPQSESHFEIQSDSHFGCLK